MNVAQARPRIWTPQVILFSILVHAAVLYYVAVAFNIVPPPVEQRDPPAVRVLTLPPTLPPTPVEPVETRPRFQQRVPAPSPVPPVVQPSPLPAIVNPVTTGPASLDVREPIQEQPVSQLLPRYPSAAQAREIEGRVRLTITIMPDGSVRDVRVMSARPQGYFESEAIRAVQQWRYRPSNVIRTNVIVDIDFVLK
jgi:periplasmic protein TonB